MSESLIIEVMQLTMQTVAMLAAPIIITVLVVGVVSQILQTVTQMRDMSLTFVPKVVAAGVVMVLCIPWYLQIVQDYTEFIFGLIGKATM